MTFEFQLSDREFSRAWLAEYFRRPGLNRLRVVVGPAIAIFGIQLFRSAHDTGGRFIAGVAIVLGLWHMVRPLAIVAMMLHQRRKTGAAQAPMRLTVDELGIEVSDGKKETRLRWADVTGAGRGSEYVWFEIRGASRGTIPLRAVPDESALVEAFRSRGKWR